MNFIKKYFINELKNYLFILIGSISAALSYVWFLAPNKITAGGLGGISIITYHLFNIPMGLMIFILNIPLFLLGIRFMGKMYGIRTLLGIVSLSFFIDLFDGKYISAIKLLPFEVDIIIVALFGGVLLGAGIGIQFRFKGSTGGTDILALLIAKFTSFTPGMAFMVIDFVIITVAGLILGINDASTNKWELIFYGLIILYVSSRVIDLVLEGLSTSKNVYIISENLPELINFINNKIERGATIIDATGSYTNEKRQIIYTVISRKEVAILREYLAKLDKNAFMVISNANQVLGYGFDKFNRFVD